MKTVDVTGCARECPQAFALPMDQPPIVITGEDGEPVLMLNDGAGTGDGPDHLQTNGFEALGPFTPAELVAALAATGQRCKLHDRFYEQELREAEVAERLKALEAEFGLDVVIEGGLMYGLGPTKRLLERREEEQGVAAG